MKPDYRKIFFEELIKLAEQDDKIVLIVPDVGFSFTEEFAKKFPKRYFNFGVTEQASTIIAAAMALSGFKSYLYSMINFVLFRNYEMVRNAICCHNANVKLIGVSGSEKYRFLGFSHNLLTPTEDFDAIKNFPNMKFYLPKSEEEARIAVLETYRQTNPAYIRL